MKYIDIDLRGAREPCTSYIIGIEGENIVEAFRARLPDKYLNCNIVFEFQMENCEKLMTKPLQWEREIVIEMPYYLMSKGRMIVAITATDKSTKAVHRLFEKTFVVLESISNQPVGDYSADAEKRLQALENAHSDWNENDPSSRAYIANRTHWKATEAITSYQTYVYGIDEDGVGKERYGNQFAIEPDTEYTFTFSGQEYVRSSFPVILDEVNERIIISDGTNNQEGLLFYCVGNTEVFQNGQVDAARIAEYIPGENELPFIVLYTPVDGYATLQTLGSYSDDELSITVQAVTFNETIHKLSSDYLPDEANDAIAKRHTHDNQATLDSLFYYDAEYPEIYDPENIPEGYMPTIDPDTSKKYLRAGEKYLRKTEDGGVITRVTTTTKKGKKYLRFSFNWDPDLFLDLEAGRSVAGRPMYVDIPVEEVNSQQGGNTLELDLGLNSMSEEIIEIQEDLSVLPDWSENDQTDRAYIANRTHWREVGSKTDVTFVKSSGEWWESGDLSTGVYGGFAYPLVEGNSYVITYNGQDYEFVAECVYQVDNGTYLETPDQTVRRYAIGNTRLATNEVFSVAPSGYTPGAADFPFCLTYETDEIQGETQILSEFAAVDSSLSDGAQVSFSVAAVSYHTLSEKYMPDSVNDSVQKKHTHDNKSTLDDITTQTLTDVAANTAARHSHSNKSIIDQLSFVDNAGVPCLTYYDCFINAYHIKNENDGYSGYLNPNTYTRIGYPETVTSFTITSLYTGFQNAGAGLANEYIVAFRTGATAPTVTFPSSVVFQQELKLEPNKFYEISIVENVALWCAVDVEVTS